MKAVLLSVAMLLGTSLAWAAKPCANFAKYGAIRAYKAEVGAVQGSHGLQHSAKLIGTRGNVSDYIVTISENNEDGDTWEFDYSVRVKGDGQECKVLRVKKIAER